MLHPGARGELLLLRVTAYRNAASLDLPWLERMRLAMFKPDRGEGPLRPGPDRVKRYRLAYEREVEALDGELVELLAFFRAHARDPVVIFTSDHGEEFLEHGGFEHGHTMYQELLSVPLAIAGLPGVEPGVAGLVDVAPTLLGALGIAPGDVDGRDLARSDPRPIRSATTLHAGDALRAVRSGPMKVIADEERIAAYARDRSR